MDITSTSALRLALILANVLSWQERRLANRISLAMGPSSVPPNSAGLSWIMVCPRIWMLQLSGVRAVAVAVSTSMRRPVAA